MGLESGCASATCPRSAASIRGCRSASSSRTSGACTGMGADAGAQRLRGWLERLGLADRATAKVEELSHGNQQRVQLAAALLHEPELLVLDEPFAGLDPVAVHTLAEVLRAEAARGAAVLFSSHQLDLVEDICEEVAIVDHGRVIASGNVDCAATPLTAAADRAPARRRAASGCRTSPASSSSSAATATCDCRADRDVDPEQVLVERSETRGRSRSATGRRRLRSSSWSWSGDERPACDHARRPARDPRAPAQPRLPRLDAAHARARRRLGRAERNALETATYQRRGDRAVTARARRRTPTRGKAVRRDGAAARRSSTGSRAAATHRQEGRRPAAPLAADRLVFR